MQTSDRAEKQRYIEELKEEFKKNLEIEAKPMIKNFPMYLEAEKEKSDMFLFMRIFCPKLYLKYVKVSSDKN